MVVWSVKVARWGAWPAILGFLMVIRALMIILIIPSFLQREKLLGMAELLFPSPGEEKMDSKVEAEEEEDLEETRWSSRRSKESESEDSGESEESGIGETGSDGSSLGR